MTGDPQVQDPDGRPVVFDSRARGHLQRKRPTMLDHIDAMMETITRPDVRLQDPRPGREQFYRQDLDGHRWLRVVVDFNTAPGFVVTAMVQHNPPRGTAV